MTTNDILAPRRRMVVRGVAWTTPAIVAAAASPAFASSTACTPTGGPASVDWKRSAYPTGYCTGTQNGVPIHLLNAGQTYTWTYTLTVTGSTIQPGVVGMRIYPYYPAKQITADQIKRYLPWTSATVTSSNPAIFQVGQSQQRVESAAQPEVYGLLFPITQIAAAPVGVYNFTLSIVVPTIVPQALSGAIMPSDVSLRSDCTQLVSRTTDQVEQFSNRLWAPRGALRATDMQPWCT